MRPACYFHYVPDASPKHLTKREKNCFLPVRPGAKKKRVCTVDSHNIESSIIRFTSFMRLKQNEKHLDPLPYERHVDRRTSKLSRCVLICYFFFLRKKRHGLRYERVDTASTCILARGRISNFKNVFDVFNRAI